MREGWAEKKLGDLASVEYGFTAKAKPEGQYRYVRITDIDNNGELIKESKMFIDSSCDTEQFILNDNDLLMARTGATFAKVLLYKDYEPSVFASYLIKIKFSEAIVNKLYWYFAKSRDYWGQANELSSGAAQPHFNGKAVKQVVFSYPVSVEDQKQIVAVLDKAFAAIDLAKANIEKNLQNAKELFQSKLNEIFTQKGEGWKEKKLGEIASVEYGYTDKSTDEGDYRYIRITDTDDNGALTKTAKKYIQASKEAEKFILRDNDLLMARTGATFAKVLLYKDYEPSIFASYLIRINFNRSMENELYWYFSKTAYYWEQANSLSSGAAQPHFNGKVLKQVYFSFPESQDKQRELTKEFKKLSAETKWVETVYQKKRDALDELKKSILQKAFAGELI